MPRARRTDTNQAAIVEALRECGVMVHDTHEVGHGFPDLVAAIGGDVYLIEVKAPEGKLNKREERWHDDWIEAAREHLVVVRSPLEALEALGLVPF
jgi:hypothetical protein